MSEQESSARRKGDEPLGLTIHTMAEASLEPPRPWSGRIKMLLVLAVCAAPVVASYLTYYVVRPEARTNYGALISPPRPLPSVQGTDIMGQPVALASLRDQWLLVSVGASACNEGCERRLYLQRQLREGLGREKDRLDWVWLRTDDTPLRPALREAVQAATVVSVAPEALQAWLEPAPGQRLEDHLYLVDPSGNWMMRFPAALDPKQARRDVERVLRASLSWDKAGRP